MSVPPRLDTMGSSPQALPVSGAPPGPTAPVTQPVGQSVEPQASPPQTSFTTLTTPPPPPRGAYRLSPKMRIIGSIVLGSLVVLGLLAFFVVQRSPRSPAVKSAQDFSSVSIPLGQLSGSGAVTVGDRTLSVNGQLRVNGSFIMTPAAQPSLPSTGQIYYDQTSNHLRYFNGTEFVQLQTDKDVQGNTTNNTTNFSGQTLGDSILTDSATFLGVDGGINLNAKSSTAQLSLYSSSATPPVFDTTDTNGAVELGIKFQVDVPGVVKGIRFYKGASQNGTFTGDLWSNTGTLLGQATFTVSTSGWQQVDFATPIPVSPDTTYIASYHQTPANPAVALGYPFDDGALSASGIDNGPLHGLASGIDGGNGVFRYTNTPALPNRTFQSTSYWVDVVFSGSIFDTASRFRVNNAQISSSDLANDTNLAKRTSSQVFSGHNIFRNASDSVDEFSIQRANATELFSTDSTSNRVYIGPQSGGGDTLLVLNNRLDVGDPPNPTDGAMYFQATEGVFRCYSNGAWSNCSDVQPSRSFTLYDEFMGGQTSFGSPISSLGWTAQAIGANGSLGFNPSAPTPVADRPGVLSVQTPASANQGTSFTLSDTSGGSMILKDRTAVRTAVAVGAATGQVLRVGLHNETTATTQPLSGVWWEANPATNANWRYCYGDGGTAVCASSGVAIAANTWVRLSISVTSTGAGTSAVTYTLGNSKFSVGSVTVDTTNRVSPALSCYGTTGSAENCYWDYFQLVGITSTSR